MFEGLQKSYPRVRRWQKAVFESLEIIFSENQKKKKKKNFIFAPCQGFADANRTINIPMLFINQHITGCGKYGIKDKLELEFNLSLSILCSSAAEFESFF